jgi:hypothetical protein
MTIGSNGGPPIRDAGWYATHRDMLNHPIVGIGKPVKPADPSRGSLSRFEAWHWLIANAAYSEQEYRNKGVNQTLQPGQLVGGRQHLAKLWNWSEKAVRWFLKVLIDEQMITLATDQIKGQPRANTANIITLCNYLKYQLGEDEVNKVEGPPKGQQGATEGPAKGQIYNKETNKQINPNSAREASRASQDKGRSYWAEAMQVPGTYNPNEGVFRDPATGVLQLINGVRATWLERFGGDELALDLALIQAAPYVKPNGAHPIRTQVEAQLAKQLGWKAERAKADKSKQSAETPTERRRRLLAQINAEGAKR